MVQPFTVQAWFVVTMAVTGYDYIIHSMVQPSDNHASLTMAQPSNMVNEAPFDHGSTTMVQSRLYHGGYYSGTLILAKWKNHQKYWYRKT